jgi:hypothetical protein
MASTNQEIAQNESNRLSVFGKTSQVKSSSILEIKMAEIEITSIHNNPIGKDVSSKLNEEYIVIRNTSKDQNFNMNGWIVSDRTPTGQETHLFYFPEKINDSGWTLDPGEYILLMTGEGTNKYIRGDGTNSPQFHFYMQRKWFVWNNSGDSAYLRLPNGEFVHWMKVP